MPSDGDLMSMMLDFAPDETVRRKSRSTTPRDFSASLEAAGEDIQLAGGCSSFGGAGEPVPRLQPAGSPDSGDFPPLVPIFSSYFATPRTVTTVRSRWR